MRPDCLMKDPSTYSEKDFKVLKNYERAMKELEGERGKYRNVLEREIEELEGRVNFWGVLVLSFD